MGSATTAPSAQPSSSMCTTSNRHVLARPHHEGEHHEARQRHAGHRGHARQPRPARGGREHSAASGADDAAPVRLGPAALISRARRPGGGAATPPGRAREARQRDEHREHDEPHGEGGRRRAAAPRAPRTPTDKGAATKAPGAGRRRPDDRPPHSNRELHGSPPANRTAPTVSRHSPAGPTLSAALSRGCKQARSPNVSY